MAILLSLAFRNDLSGIIYLILFATCVGLKREQFYRTGLKKKIDPCFFDATFL